ncbi:MAG: VOC family protein [Myxococcota bacterium]|jgi:lactoylglutathione lyase
MAKAIHSMIRVFDLERSMDFYREAFGLALVERLDFDDFTLAYLRNAESEFELELTWNHDQEVPYEHGSGYGHLAVTVDDVEEEHARFEAKGLAPRKLVSMEHAGKQLARIFFVQDPDGYEIEVIQRAGRFI